MADCKLCKKYLAYETSEVRARLHRKYHTKQSAYEKARKLLPGDTTGIK